MEANLGFAFPLVGAAIPFASPFQNDRNANSRSAIIKNAAFVLEAGAGTHIFLEPNRVKFDFGRVKPSLAQLFFKLSHLLITVDYLQGT